MREYLRELFGPKAILAEPGYDPTLENRRRGPGDLRRYGLPWKLIFYLLCAVLLGVYLFRDQLTATAGNFQNAPATVAHTATSTSTATSTVSPVPSLTVPAFSTVRLPGLHTGATLTPVVYPTTTAGPGAVLPPAGGGGGGGGGYPGPASEPTDTPPHPTPLPPHPTATSSPAPTSTTAPTVAASATTEPTACPSATTEPTATASATTEPTSTTAPTEPASATPAPTEAPTEAPTATTEPTGEPAPGVAASALVGDAPWLMYLALVVVEPGPVCGGEL